MEKAQDGAQGLIKALRHTFATYGIPDELTSDGGPEFIAHNTRQFLKDWGVHHRLSSVGLPTQQLQSRNWRQNNQTANLR